MRAWRIFMVLKAEEEHYCVMRDGFYPVVPERKTLHYCATCDDTDFVFSRTVRECAIYVAGMIADENVTLSRSELRNCISFPIPTVFRLDDGQELACGPLDVTSAGLFLEVLYFYYGWYTQYHTVSELRTVQ